MRCVLPIVFAIAFAGCGATATSEDQVVSDYDEAEMDAAIEKAKATIDVFVKELKDPTGEDHAVKVGISDSKNTEYFWMSDLTFDGTQFKGTINNEPMLVDNVEEGQSWSVAKADAVDWMFTKDGKIHGNRTMVPLLKSMPKAEADAFREMLADQD